MVALGAKISVLNGTQGEVGVFFFLGRLIFILSPHKCKLGDSMCNKLTDNVVNLRYNFSLSDCHFSLILLEGEDTSPYWQGPA